MRHRLTSAAVAVALLAAPGAWALDAEYAIRWYPSEGGPATIADVVSLLGQTVKKRQQAVVTYVQVTSPSALPTEQRLIARERVFTAVADDPAASKKKSGAKTEVMMKLRVPEAQISDAKHWSCPLTGPTERKLEVDVSWPPSPQTRAISVSCKAEDQTMLEAIPSTLRPRPGPCAASTMVRAKTEEGITIERWTLPSGQIVIEVSMSGNDDAAGVDGFRRLVVDKLKGVKPLQEGMTTLAGTCAAKC